MPARTTPFRAAVHLQCLASGCSSGRAPVAVLCTRPQPRPAAAQRRPFHGTRSLRDDIDDKNHYETLNVQPNASAAEIKKSFYTLSKTHHPDHNRADPHAPRRFMRISEAYTTLSQTASRAKYDRDVLRLHEHRGGGGRGGGSYHSTQRAGSGPVGARPASGLSRRRGTFRGPPPSFFRSGGWGAHGAKRGAAHEESTGSGSFTSSTSSSSSSSPRPETGEEQQATGGYGAGGMGPGHAPPPPGGSGFSGAADEVSHFDRAAKEAHTRTQAYILEAARARARARQARKEGGFREDIGAIGRFFGVATILMVGMSVPYMGIAMWQSATGRDNKKGYGG